MSKLLKFSQGNAKLTKDIFSLSLPSGFACPFASDCLSKAEKTTGKLTDGKNTKFRCFSASQENRFPKTREQRWYNFDLLKKLNKEKMIELISASLPIKAAKIRIHVAGDYFSQAYFDAWVEVARQNPTKIFYGYTKSLQYWINRLDVMPENFILTASKGGKLDELIAKHNLRFAEVVFTIEKAEELGLEIDHDDSNAFSKGGSFALLIHGTQPTNSEASKSKSANQKKGIMGYTRKKGRVITNEDYSIAG